eukprot:1192692-Prorocentrum_minimum.AAC.2
MEKSSKLLLAKLLLLFLNFVFLGFAIALIVLAFSHSHYTTLLANIYASGNTSLLDQPDNALLIVGAALLFIATKGIIGACYANKRVLVFYTLFVLALLTALVYIAAMMFIYREDAADLIHAYWNRYSEGFDLLSPEETPAIPTEVLYMPPVNFASG